MRARVLTVEQAVLLPGVAVLAAALEEAARVRQRQHARDGHGMPATHVVRAQPQQARNLHRTPGGHEAGGRHNAKGGAAQGKKDAGFANQKWVRAAQLLAGLSAISQTSPLPPAFQLLDDFHHIVLRLRVSQEARPRWGGPAAGRG
jgi:hypothetical protein